MRKKITIVFRTEAFLKFLEKLQSTMVILLRRVVEFDGVDQILRLNHGGTDSAVQ